MNATRTTLARCGSAALLAASLAACAGTMSGALTDVQPAPKLDMNGRWLLTAKNSPPCGMAFRAAADGQNGSILPEGGCPEDFFKSRIWSFETGDLVIQNQDNELLAQLRFVGGRFEGKSTVGTSVILARTILPVN
jgi:predicted small secreted protein